MERHPLVRVFTFKQGLLSALAHDLQLVLQRFDIELDDGKIYGSFDLESLLVEGAVKSGRLDQKCLSDSDCRKIRHNALHEVLKVDRYPEARFEGTLRSTHGEGKVDLDGSLSLAGRRCAIDPATAISLSGVWVTTIEITPSRWGIRPYRAMGGTLRLQDRIKVEVSLPAPDARDWSWKDAKKRWSAGAASPTAVAL